MADRSPALGIRILAGCLAAALSHASYSATAPAPAEEPDAGTSPSTVGATGGGGARWRVPPINYWGTLSYENRFDSGEQQSSIMQQLLTAKLNGSSYLWQPWFATVDGGVGVSFARSDTGESGSGSRNAFVTGSGQVRFLPRSRFPFEAHVEVGDSRTGGGIAAYDQRTLRAGVSQNYRPELGRYTLFSRFEHASQTTRAFGTNSQDALTAEYRSHWKEQSLEVAANLSLAQSPSSGEETESDSLVARHHYSPSTAFSVDTTGSLVRERRSLLAGGFDTAGAQLSTVGIWRPTARPLTVTGSARFGVVNASGEASDTRAVAGHAGASYLYSRNLQFTLSGNANFFSSSATSSSTHGASAGAVYSGDTQSYAGYNYDWSIGVSGGYQGGGAAGTVALASSQFNQALSRTFRLPDGSTLSSSVGANLGAVMGSAGSEQTDDRSDNAVQLGSTASLTWSKSAGPTSGYARLSFSDTRQLYGQEQSFFQLANLQVSGTWNFSRYDSLIGDFTYQYSRQDPGFLRLKTNAELISGAPQSSTTITANITYTHSRLFGVPRLRFVSQLQLTDAAVVQENVLGTPEDQVARWWDNRIQYMIGRLTTTLAARVYEIQGVRRQGIYFRIERAIGSGG